MKKKKGKEKKVSRAIFQGKSRMKRRMVKERKKGKKEEENIKIQDEK